MSVRTPRVRPAVALLAAALLLFASALAPDATQASDSTVIGQSVRGRPIEVGCAGPSAAEAAETMLVVGGIHTGMEEVTSTLALGLAQATWSGTLDLPEHVRLCFLPTLNPDGLASGEHTNANGVDLNRNWPAADWQADAYHPETGAVSGGSAPLSEPETRALFEYVRTTQPSLVVVLHCCGSLVEANSEPLAVDLAHAYGAATGFDYLPTWNFYTITGEFIDAMERMRIPAFDVELARHDDADVETHRAGLEAVLEQLALRGRRADTNTFVGGTVASSPAEPWTRPTVAFLYRVRHGETIWGLASRFGVTTNALAAANNITHPSHFVPGRVLAVPAAVD